MLCGHSRGYERSFPVRGFDSAGALRPHPVTTVDSGVFDTSQGTVHLVLGGAGGRAEGRPRRRALTAVENAAWSARRDTATGYGVAVFDVNPGRRGRRADLHHRPVLPRGRRRSRRRCPTRRRRRPTTTPSSTPSRWSGRDPTGGAGTRRSPSRRTSPDARPGPASPAAASRSCTVESMAAADIVVVGAGVVGLSTAISLAEAGLSTRVVAAEPPSRVTSVAAGAIWGPVRCGPDDRCLAWARTGLEVLGALADEPSAGVHQAARARGGAGGGVAPAVGEPAGRPAAAGRRRAAGRVLVRLVLHRARGQHAGLPASTCSTGTRAWAGASSTPRCRRWRRWTRRSW